MCNFCFVFMTTAIKVKQKKKKRKQHVIIKKKNAYTHTCLCYLCGAPSRYAASRTPTVIEFFFFFLDSSTSVFLSPDLFPPSSHWTSTALLKVIERMLRGVAAARVYVLQRHALTLTGKKRKPRKRNSEPIEEKKQNNNWIAFQTKIKK